MGNIFNTDFLEFLTALNASDVRYVLVGGYAVILHGYSRTTGDMDIWVARTAENYQKLRRAFLSFGMPVFDMTEENFLNHPTWDVFSFGRPPSSIDIMVNVKGLSFEEAFKETVLYEEAGVKIRVISLHQLRQAKKEAGRNKDLNDLEHL